MSGRRESKVAERMRAFSEKNQAVFQTVVAGWVSIVALVLAAASLYVAGSQARSSQAQADAALLQVELAQAQTQPNLQIDFGYSKPLRGSSLPPETYTLVNKGFPAANITVEALGFLRVAPIDSTGEETSRAALIPFERYLGAPRPGHVAGSAVYERVGDPRSDLALGPELRDVSVDGTDFEASPCVFFNVRYLDIFGQPRRLMYYADENRSFRVSAEDARRIDEYIGSAAENDWVRPSEGRDPRKVYKSWSALWPKQDLRFLQADRSFAPRLRMP